MRDCAAAIGFIVRKKWGAHSGRIGGATDLAATGKASQLLLQAKAEKEVGVRLGAHLCAHDSVVPAGSVEAHAYGPRSGSRGDSS